MGGTARPSSLMSQSVEYVERFVSKIVEILDQRPEHEQLSLAIARTLSAFVGRVGVTETGFAPRGDVANALREARTLISQRIDGDGPNKHAVLLEIDKTLAIVGRNVIPPQGLS